jgi:two-component system, sensor histidine kinase LadS
MLALAVVASACVLWISAQAPDAHSKPHAGALGVSSPAQNDPPPLVRLTAGQTKLDLLPSTQYWIDQNKDTTAAAIQANILSGRAKFVPSSSTDAHSIDGKVLWLRFDVKAHEAHYHWLLEFGSPLIDDVSLHWLNSKGQWTSQHAGDVVPRKDWPLHTRLPTFKLQSETTDAVSYFLRIENARFPVSLPMVVYGDSTYLAALLSGQNPNKINWLASQGGEIL